MYKRLCYACLKFYFGSFLTQNLQTAALNIMNEKKNNDVHG